MLRQAVKKAQSLPTTTWASQKEDQASGLHGHAVRRLVQSPEDAQYAKDSAINGSRAIRSLNENGARSRLHGQLATSVSRAQAVKKRMA
jgi:hypothetical protein